MKKLPVALQLYSVRDMFAEDMLGTLEQVAALGYDGVELGGGFGNVTPAQIKAKLDELGLKAVGAHMMLDSLAEAETLEAVKTLGLPTVALPVLLEDQRPGKPAFADTIARIKALIPTLKALGVSLLYHNHAFEFEKVDGQYGLDLLRGFFTPDEMNLEIDVCWVRFAGLDPMAYLRENAGRCPLLHMKDYIKDPEFTFKPVGEGVQDVKALLEAADDAGVSWLVVEQDLWEPLTSIECARRSLAHIREAQG